MRLDADQPGGSAAFGAGRAKIGRARTEINLKCVHGRMVRPLKVFASEYFTDTDVYQV
jgi:hypothetical protein